ncbi:thiamine phosphate synthase [Spirosoma sp. HMF3257]|uniref:Thiamine-phosphate synthase n=1 Tax=Spirosoma telluris TaxID=2183553 RepID=A0A327NPU6_9BACT|nr:thiamine phosphate synthase [Spirosoma telluris]RAI77272.1 thiamine phosphate synthase [Spirosoma telluris]
MSSLYLVTDSAIAQQAGHTLAYVVDEACRAGIRWVQLREKSLSTRAFLELGTVLKRITQTYGANLIINDRVDIALAIDADGVHVGQDDMPCSLVRSLIGPNKIIGLSINNLAELEAARDVDVNYLGIATIFPTSTKQDTSSLLGLEGLQLICQRTTLPTFAIGGINTRTIQEIARTRATGSAVVSAICGHPSPYEATRELIKLMDDA